MMNRRIGIWLGVLLLLLVTACAPGGDSVDDQNGLANKHNGHDTEKSEEHPAASFMHIHGLSYDPQAPHDLYMSTHHGVLKLDKTGVWIEIGEEEHRHDLMGFTFQKEGIMISSGHPAEKSKLKDPLGIVISKNQGETWEPIALHGKVDFHVMEVNAGNPLVMHGLNSHGPHAGLYRSEDGGYEWGKLETSGFPTDLMSIFSLVSDPGDPRIILAGTGNGILKSEDGGITWSMDNDQQSFLAAASVTQPSAKLVAYVLGENEGLMVSEDLGETWSSLHLLLEEDAVIHIAIHPTQEGVYTVGTHLENLFHTTDGGATWTQIAQSGKPIKQR
jgi:photosystem II stability/assembly factor-like uncharacterized protein